MLHPRKPKCDSDHAVRHATRSPSRPTNALCDKSPRWSIAWTLAIAAPGGRFACSPHGSPGWHRVLRRLRSADRFSDPCSEPSHFASHSTSSSLPGQRARRTIFPACGRSAPKSNRILVPTGRCKPPTKKRWKNSCLGGLARRQRFAANRSHRPKRGQRRRGRVLPGERAAHLLLQLLRHPGSENRQGSCA